MGGVTAVGFFLMSVLFTLIGYSLWIRISLRYLRISPLTPLGHMIYSVTDPLVKPLNALFKGSYKPSQKFDTLAFCTLVILEFLKILGLGLIAFHAIVPVHFLILYVLADLIIQPCNLLFYAILIRVIMSYLQPQWQHPLAEYLHILTEPILIWGRKKIPNKSGFDFSPIIIMILLKVVTLFIGASLPWRLL